MGFLDNSGDIILDAVLTDLGRKRLAEGNGSFKIAKFALGDDEINYGLYDKNNISGSAYYDLNILQTPVLEAFTNNMSSMKSRLMSIARNDLLYLPVIKLFNEGNTALNSEFSNYLNLVDRNTVDSLAGTGNNVLPAGIINGDIPSQGTNLIEVDQGLDTIELPGTSVIAQDLLETQYFIQIDNRLGFLAAPGTNANTNEALSFTPTSIDDDQIATYIFTLNDDANVVTRIGENDASAIVGPRGTKVRFKIGSSLDLKTSTFLFTQLGSLGTTAITGQGGATIAVGGYRYIDSTVRVSGISTGYTVDLPVRFVKKTT
jgi:hypothetical protein|tara:strand:- start:693 stop:1643 length:951 start_codon:yes stop_codon:yes gene_type:complete